MPPEMRRPGHLHLPEWMAALDDHLAGQVVTSAPLRRRRFSGAGLLRVARSVTRPVGHAAAALAAAMVVVTTAGIPTPSSPGDTTEPAAVVSPVASITEPAVVPVMNQTQVERSSLLALLPPEDARAFVSRRDIQNDLGELTEAPPSEARAVPTPEGGGSAEATLRPTVR